MGDGLSDIGRFSLPESFFEGTRRSRARGLFEHVRIHLPVGRIIEVHLGVRMYKQAEFRRAEKVDEGWREKSDWSENIPNALFFYHEKWDAYLDIWVFIKNILI